MDADPVALGGGGLVNARTLCAAQDRVELFLYRGDQQLFADRSLPAYDRDAGTLLTVRTLDFLAAVDPGGRPQGNTPVL